MPTSHYRGWLIHLVTEPDSPTIVHFKARNPRNGATISGSADSPNSAELKAYSEIDKLVQPELTGTPS